MCVCVFCVNVCAADELVAAAQHEQSRYRYQHELIHLRVMLALRQQMWSILTAHVGR